MTSTHESRSGENHIICLVLYPMHMTAEMPTTAATARPASSDMTTRAEPALVAVADAIVPEVVAVPVVDAAAAASASCGAYGAGCALLTVPFQQ